MTNWIEIDNFDALMDFQDEFRAMTNEERAAIIVEMLAVIEAYRLGIEVIEHEASTSRQEPPLLRKKRRGRARKSKAQRYQEDHQLNITFHDLTS